MDLAVLFEDVKGLKQDFSIVRAAKIKTSEKRSHTSNLKSQAKEPRENNTNKTGKSKKESDKKQKDTTSIAELLNTVIEIEEKDVIDVQIDSIDNKGYEISHMKQYAKLMLQYQRFLDAYLKDYKPGDANSGVEMPEYTDAFARTDVVVPKRNFGVGQDVMTHSEIRDIVRRKRMNWAMGGEHNYVSPDEKDRYKMWKMCSKFNYIMSEGCWFTL
ncbi:hypothetical protein HN695_06035 [Candidatus Woesearchaeota archaeon]|jgi:hypothetical protein|nr:hypothetical protein [Candidatus Woesearchaeota archaeon]MBT5272677.1 hypothetical protein [Candidatus Woesearchaeota archaeon]MBT6041284.1 hypothetical protein [Candidatus Woesearchaeota archaeon]MBT6337078.1 hypothetical protein [Candidatus Woesearchaeota archaeon]MBT7927868.1 hypothetical protein [Candidatus Woesearchaeota archaeon]